MIAFLEDMPLRRAVKRLELAREDLDQLDPHPPPRARPCRSRRPWPDASAGGGQRPDRENELQEAEEESQARERIGQRVRELERLRRRVRGEWQEKLLALRLEDLLGPRLVKVLETAVLWLILILVGLIVGRGACWIAPAGSPTPTAPGSPGPTW